jgi:hypothetical protein
MMTNTAIANEEQNIRNQQEGVEVSPPSRPIRVVETAEGRIGLEMDDDAEPAYREPKRVEGAA